jgi:hypothetical protein
MKSQRTKQTYLRTAKTNILTKVYIALRQPKIKLFLKSTLFFGLVVAGYEIASFRRS